jgi:hypothetical protein
VEEIDNLQCRWRLKALQLGKDFKHLQKVLSKIEAMEQFAQLFRWNY